ncbi:hypothetical protein FSP39_006905 [Pinctada imbricata]|uniref:Mutator-like transposase domain-containing protein n=1 Tax=Pinctada imbricata TaxID=66713 RepID=A0AA88YUZ1_PINIB|nr:hypothetical protein FSP39_006905 [Pinctada imbricata]
MLSYDTDGHMNTSLYNERDDFNFSIKNFPFLSSKIPSSPAHGVFISQLIRFARASTKYTDFVLRARRLSDKLLIQGYVCDRLTSSLRKFYGRYGELTMMSHSPELWMIFCHRPFEPPNQRLYSVSYEMEETGCDCSPPFFYRIEAAGVACKQEMFTLPRHLVSLPYREFDSFHVVEIPCSNINCKYINHVPTGKRHGEQSRTWDVNLKLANALTHAGIGVTQLNSFLTALNIPPVHHKLADKRKTVMGLAVESVAHDSILESIEEETALTQQ